MKTSLHIQKKGEWADMYNSGMSFRAIASEAGVSKATVQNVIKDIIVKRSKSPYDKFGKKWVDLYVNQAYLLSHIAIKYNTSIAVVSRVLENEGVSIEKNVLATRKYTHLVSSWIKQYNDGLSLREISELSSVNAQTILNYFREEGVEVRNYSESSRKYELDEEYFNEIDTPAKAYWLGVFFARGSTLEHLNSWSISLALPEDKLNMLIEFQKVIKTERPFTRRKEEITVDLRLQSRPLFEQMRKLGLNKDKRKALDFPEKLPGQFTSVFIKGYIDARGYFDKRVLYVGGTPSFLNTLAEIFQLTVGIECEVKKITHIERDSYVLKVQAKELSELNEWLNAIDPER